MDAQLNIGEPKILKQSCLIHIFEKPGQPFHHDILSWYRSVPHNNCGHGARQHMTSTSDTSPQFLFHGNLGVAVSVQLELRGRGACTGWSGQQHLSIQTWLRVQIVWANGGIRTFGSSSCSSTGSRNQIVSRFPSTKSTAPTAIGAYCCCGKQLPQLVESLSGS